MFAGRYKMNPVQLFYDNPYFENLQLTRPFIEYLEKEEQQLRRTISGGRSLDLGCGNGRSTKILSDICDEVIGVDFSERLLEQARKNVKDVNFYLENAIDLHFEDSNFDYVVMTWNTFGNLYSRKDAVLRESKRVLKPEGKILMSVFSEDILPAYFEMLEQSGLVVVHYNENNVFLREGLISERFSERKLKEILQRQELDVRVSPLTNISYWCEARKIITGQGD